MKPFLVFACAFICGAAVALGVRVVRHEPYARPAAVQMQPVADAGGGAVNAVVNTVCAVCGMEVDSDVPPAVYEGKRIGFGCAACPPKFAKEPGRYGPYALRNEIAPR